MKKKKTLAALEPYLWLLPSILLMTIFILFPTFEVFRTSMSEVSKAGLVKGFCGFDNFAKVLRGSTFKLVLKNTLVWTIGRCCDLYCVWFYPGTCTEQQVPFP